MAVQVLQRAFSILDLLALRDAGLAELARETGLQKTTLHNILKTLVELGAVQRTADGRYALGPKIPELGEGEYRRTSLQPLAQRIAADLCSAVQETVVISVLRGAERYVLAYAVGPQELTVRIDLSTGKSPYDATTGRVLLAFLPEAERRRIIEARGLPGDEWRAITTREELDAALDEIRRNEVALHLHVEQEIQTVAVPVFGPNGGAWASIGIRMPASRFLNGRREAILAGLREASSRMSDLLSLPKSS